MFDVSALAAPRLNTTDLGIVVPVLSTILAPAGTPLEVMSLETALATRFSSDALFGSYLNHASHVQYRLRQADIESNPEIRMHILGFDFDMPKQIGKKEKEPITPEVFERAVRAIVTVPAKPYAAYPTAGGLRMIYAVGGGLTFDVYRKAYTAMQRLFTKLELAPLHVDEQTKDLCRFFWLPRITKNGVDMERLIQERFGQTDIVALDTSARLDLSVIPMADKTIVSSPLGASFFAERSRAVGEPPGPGLMESVDRARKQSLRATVRNIIDVQHYILGGTTYTEERNAQLTRLIGQICARAQNYTPVEIYDFLYPLLQRQQDQSEQEGLSDPEDPWTEWGWSQINKFLQKDEARREEERHDAQVLDSQMQAMWVYNNPGLVQIKNAKWPQFAILTPVKGSKVLYPLQKDGTYSSAGQSMETIGKYLEEEGFGSILALRDGSENAIRAGGSLLKDYGAVVQRLEYDGRTSSPVVLEVLNAQHRSLCLRINPHIPHFDPSWTPEFCETFDRWLRTVFAGQTGSLWSSDYEFINAYLAWFYELDQRLPMVSLLGPNGCGKTFLIEQLCRPWNRLPLTQRAFLSSKNAQVLDIPVAHFEEGPWAGGLGKEGLATADILKGAITGVADAEIKYVDANVVKSYYRFILSANDQRLLRHCIGIGNKSRDDLESLAERTAHIMIDDCYARMFDEGEWAGITYEWASRASIVRHALWLRERRGGPGTARFVVRSNVTAGELRMAASSVRVLGGMDSVAKAMIGIRELIKFKRLGQDNVPPWSNCIDYERGHLYVTLSGVRWAYEYCFSVREQLRHSDLVKALEELVDRRPMYGYEEGRQRHRRRGGEKTNWFLLDTSKLIDLFDVQGDSESSAFLRGHRGGFE